MRIRSTTDTTGTYLLNFVPIKTYNTDNENPWPATTGQARDLGHQGQSSYPDASKAGACEV